MRRTVLQTLRTRHAGAPPSAHPLHAGAALAFTAICLASQNLFIFLPEALAAMGKLPHTFLVPLIQGNLLVHLASLALLTLAAAYSCMLCLGKRGKNA